MQLVESGGKGADEPAGQQQLPLQFFRVAGQRSSDRDVFHMDVGAPLSLIQVGMGPSRMPPSRQPTLTASTTTTTPQRFIEYIVGRTRNRACLSCKRPKHMCTDARGWL